MEKKSLLDACVKTFGLMLLVLAAAGCAGPRIGLFRDPLTPEEHINLGVSYERRGELDAALKEYQAAAKKMPIAYLYTGNVHFKKGALDNAEKAYKKAIEKTASPEAYNNLAWLYYTRGARLEEAERLASKATALSPGSDSFKDTLEKIREKRNE